MLNVKSSKCRSSFAIRIVYASATGFPVGLNPKFNFHGRNKFVGEGQGRNPMNGLVQLYLSTCQMSYLARVAVLAITAALGRHQFDYTVIAEAWLCEIKQCGEKQCRCYRAVSTSKAGVGNLVVSERHF